MAEFTKDYDLLIKKASENGESDLVSSLTRQRDNEIYLSDEGLQREAGKKAAERRNAQANGVGGKKI